MINPLPYDPDYCVVPGLTLAETMLTKNLTVIEIARLSEQSEEYVWGVIVGKSSITGEFSKSLEIIFDIPATFWNNLQRNFDELKAAGKTVTGWPKRHGDTCVPVTLCSARNQSIK